MYIYSDMPKWLAVSENKFSTYIYSMSYDAIFFENFGRLLEISKHRSNSSSFAKATAVKVILNS